MPSGQMGDVVGQDRAGPETLNMWATQNRFRDSRTPGVRQAFSDAGWLSQLPYNGEDMLRALAMTIGEDGARRFMMKLQDPNLTPGQVRALATQAMDYMRASDDINNPSGVLKSSQNLQSAAELARQSGDGADSVLAHIHPLEAQLLERAFGSSGVNAKTGLPQYGASLNASGLIGAVKQKSRADQFREGLQGLLTGGVSAPVAPKPLPVTTAVASPYGTTQTPQQRLGGAQDRLMGLVGRFASKQPQNALMGRGPINALLMGWRGRG